MPGRAAAKAAFIIVLVAVHVGCDDDSAAVGRRPGGATVRKKAAAPPPREVVCNLDNVKVFLNPGGTVRSIDVSVSPDGRRVAVFRSVSFTMNNWMRRVEIDGQRGPTFRTISGGRWSDDGSTFVYVGDNFQGQLAGSHVVYASQRHGPYERVESLAISTDGASWAAFCREQRDGPLLLIVDGQARPLKAENPPVPDSLRFHPIWKTFIYKRATDPITERWLTIEGKPIDPPQILPPPAPPFPPGKLLAVKKVGKAKDARQQLLVNGAVTGEYAAVLPRTDSRVPAYPQADGTLIVYVVEGNHLVRLRF